MYKKILVEADKFNNEPVIVVSGTNWHEGVIGIVASKINETDKIEQTFLLYSYKNSKDIIAYVMHNEGSLTKDTPILVGYKVGDDTFYTVLLDLQ